MNKIVKVLFYLLLMSLFKDLSIEFCYFIMGIGIISIAQDLFTDKFCLFLINLGVISLVLVPNIVLFVTQYFPEAEILSIGINNFSLLVSAISIFVLIVIPILIPNINISGTIKIRTIG